MRTHGAAASVVLYSAGALSAFNALASAYAERFPVILISGSPNITELADGVARRIYRVSGDSMNGITDSLRAEGVRREETAAFAAGAEAHLTSTLAVCAESRGPGNLHLIKRTRRQKVSIWRESLSSADQTKTLVATKKGKTRWPRLR